MKKFIFIMILQFGLCLINKCFAANDSTKIKDKRNSIYVEFLGNGLLGSLNYERIFNIKNQKCSFGIGALYLPVNSIVSPIKPKRVIIYSDQSKAFFPNPFFVPVRFNLIFGKHHLFIPGIGITYESGNHMTYIYNFYSGAYLNYASIYLMLTPLHYRYNFTKKGFFIGGQIGWLQRLFLFGENFKRAESIEINKQRPNFGFYVGKKF